MTYQAKNNAFSTLAGSLTNVATTLTVQAGHGDRFPVIAAPDYTMVTLEDNSGNREIVKVTARASASDSMTIVRAQEGTTARAWASGDSVELRMTAGEVQTLFNHVDDTADAHAASAITNTPSGNLVATNVQAALNELQSDIDTRELSINAATAKVTPVDADAMGLIDSAASNVLKKVTWSNIKATLKAYFDTLYTNNSALTAHVNDTTDAHAASAITNTPAGNIAATTVQAAINELDSEKHPVMASATQAEMEAGTETALRAMSPNRIKQAISALSTGGFKTTEFIYSNTTWTVPAGVTKIRVTVVGGGGGGGNSSKKGGAGASSSFGSLISCTGGDTTLTAPVPGVCTATGYVANSFFRGYESEHIREINYLGVLSQSNSSKGGGYFGGGGGSSSSAAAGTGGTATSKATAGGGSSGANGGIGFGSGGHGSVPGGAGGYGVAEFKVTPGTNYTVAVGGGGGGVYTVGVSSVAGGDGSTGTMAGGVSTGNPGSGGTGAGGGSGGRASSGAGGGGGAGGIVIVEY